MSTEMIPLDKIRPPAWNSRLNSMGPESTEESRKADSVKIDGLAQSMDNDGLINPITVEGPDAEGMYELVTGSRRTRAAMHLGWKEIKAEVGPITDSATRIIRNVTENQQRQDLTLFEQARACARLRDEKISIKQIAAKTGLSEQYVSNLAVMFHRLPSLITAQWQAQHEAATFTFLREITSAAADKSLKTDEAKAERMIEMWQKRVELYNDFQESMSAEEDEPDEDEPAANGKSSTKKKIEKYTVTAEHFKALSAALKKSRVPGTALALSALKVCIGVEDSIKGVFEPKEELTAE